MDLAAYNFSFYVIYILTDKKWRELTIISGDAKSRLITVLVAPARESAGGGG
jgi:hypothetical protein